MHTNTPSASSSAPPTTAVTVLLTTEQTARLDELSAAIRRTTGQSIRRSVLIRAFTEALLPYGESFQNCRSQSEITDKVVRTITKAFSRAG